MKILESQIYRNEEFKFTKIDGKQCLKSAYRPSYLMSDAKSACLSDEKCIGVYDRYCDGEPPFHLCSNVQEQIYPLEDYTHSQPEPNPISCILEKQSKCYFIFSNI